MPTQPLLLRGPEEGEPRAEEETTGCVGSSRATLQRWVTLQLRLSLLFLFQRTACDASAGEEAGVCPPPHLWASVRNFHLSCAEQHLRSEGFRADRGLPSAPLVCM